MSVKVLYNDLRTVPPELRRMIVAWNPGLRADSALQDAIGSMDAQRVIADLDRNDREIMVSWGNEATGEISEVGGVGTLDWQIDDRSVLVVTYESAATSQSSIDAAVAWMLEDEQQPW